MTSFEKIREKLLKKEEEEEKKRTKLVKKIGRKGKKKTGTKGKRKPTKIPKDMNSNEILKTLEKISKSNSVEEANRLRKKIVKRRRKLLDIAEDQREKFQKKGMDTDKMDEKIKEQKEALKEAQKASEDWLKEKKLKKKT